jgi:hypothetical protein
MRREYVLALVVALLAVALTAQGQYTVAESVVSCGGGVMRTSANRMIGTVGQAAIGVMSNGHHTAQGGFWYQPGWILTGVPGGEELAPVFMLSQNRPNPFNPVTTIDFGVEQRTRVTVRLYDVRGREVRTLVDDERDPGLHSVVLNASGLASGVYMCRMEAGSFVAERKLVLLK